MLTENVIKAYSTKSNMVVYQRLVHILFNRTEEHSFKVVDYWKKQNLEKVIISDMKILRKTTYILKSVISFCQTLAFLLTQSNIIPYE